MATYKMATNYESKFEQFILFLPNMKLPWPRVRRRGVVRGHDFRLKFVVHSHFVVQRLLDHADLLGHEADFRRETRLPQRLRLVLLWANSTIRRTIQISDMR
jgi:hypothetical protein